MNYLAHFHLAGSEAGYIQGALLGDFVKGPLRGQYPTMTEKGIALHRKIDAISNDACEIKLASRELPPALRRYAGIITDVVFDYFLSHHWNRFHSVPLEQFAQSIYRTLSDDREWPENARHFSRRLIEYDLLCQYGQWSTVERVIASIGARLSRDNPLHGAAGAIKPQLEPLEQAFLNIYPKLQQDAANFIAQSS